MAGYKESDPFYHSAAWKKVRAVALMRDLIELHTQEGMLVLDPFMGGGTTAVAAAMENRRCIGIELVPKYFEIAKRRVWDEVSQLNLFR